jgi:hypothetical protein
MEKKLQSVFSVIEPKNKNVIWIHRKEGKLIQQLWSNKGWEDIGSFEDSSSGTDTLENPFYFYIEKKSDFPNVSDYTKVLNPYAILDLGNGNFFKFECNDFLSYEGLTHFNHLDDSIQGVFHKKGDENSSEAFSKTVSTYYDVNVSTKISDFPFIFPDYIGILFHLYDREFRGHIKWREGVGGLGIAYDVYGNSLPITVDEEGVFSYNYPLYYNSNVVVYCNSLDVPESEIPSYYKEVNAKAFANINKGDTCILANDWFLEIDGFMLSGLPHRYAILKAEMVCVEKTSNECILLAEKTNDILIINIDGTATMERNTGYVNPNTDIYSKYKKSGGTKSKEEFYSKLFELIE